MINAVGKTLSFRFDRRGILIPDEKDIFLVVDNR